MNTPPFKNLQERRELLRLAGWTALSSMVPLAIGACGGGDDEAATVAQGGTTSTTTTTTTASSSSSSASSASCQVIESETQGPYPADGTNGNGGGLLDVLTLAGVIRQDIRPSFNGATGVAAGVPLTVKLKLVNVSGSCAPLAGYAIYIWHCDRGGNYSLYNTGVTAENYLRGVQVTDANGEVAFTSIFPGCYSGRWPHIHIEVFRSAQVATSGTNSLKTTQLALAADSCKAAYATTGYEASVTNLSRISIASDGIFGDDNAAYELATMTGDAASGFTASLEIGIAA